MKYNLVIRNPLTNDVISSDAVEGSTSIEVFNTHKRDGVITEVWDIFMISKLH